MYVTTFMSLFYSDSFNRIPKLRFGYCCSTFAAEQCPLLITMKHYIARRQPQGKGWQEKGREGQKGRVRKKEKGKQRGGKKENKVNEQVKSLFIIFNWLWHTRKIKYICSIVRIVQERETAPLLQKVCHT